jgi:hypothetical protein
LFFEAVFFADLLIESRSAEFGQAELIEGGGKEVVAAVD